MDLELFLKQSITTPVESNKAQPNPQHLLNLHAEKEIVQNLTAGTLYEPDEPVYTVKDS